MARTDPYCFKCQKHVKPQDDGRFGLRCPKCKRVLWEAHATSPDHFKHDVRTTKETYRMPTEEKKS